MEGFKQYDPSEKPPETPEAEKKPEEKPFDLTQSKEKKIETEGKRAYSKEEWFGMVEILKEQAAVSREKEKIEEKEEIIELAEGVIVEKPEKAEINNLTRLLKSVREGRREKAELEVELKKIEKKKPPAFLWAANPVFWSGLEEQEKSYQKAKTEKMPEFGDAEKFYNDAQKQLIDHLFGKAEERWRKDPEKFKKFYERFVCEGFVGKERERLQKAKEDAMEPKEKGRLRKLGEAAMRQYAKLPKAARWGISAGIGTAVAFGGAAAGLIAAPAIGLAGYTTIRYGRAMFGSLSAVGIKGMGDMAEKQWLKKHGKEAREKKIKENLIKEAADFSDREKAVDLAVQAKDKRNEELAKLAKRQKQWRIGKMAAMIGGGAGISFAAGSLDSFSAKPGIADTAREQMVGIKPTGPQAAQLFERAEESRFIGRPQAEIFERAEESRVIGAVPEPEKFSEAWVDTVHPGDSVWKIAERNLESHGYFRGFTGTAEEIQAKKDFLTDWVKDQVVEDKTKFGLADVADIEKGLPPGHKFDLTEVLKNKREALLGEVNNAENLSIGQMKHILHNRELNTEWLKNHPGEALTTPKVAEILGGKRLEILIEQRPSAAISETLAERRAEGIIQEPEIEVIRKEGIEVTAEDYLRGLNQEQREMIDTQWEDYNELPSLSEDEIRGLEDYYYGGHGNEEDLALGLFYDRQAELRESILDILAPSKLRIPEYMAIKNVTVGKFLEEAAKNSNEYWPQLPHSGVYDFMELGRQMELAKFLRGTMPTELGKMLTLDEYLKNFIK